MRFCEGISSFVCEGLHDSGFLYRKNAENSSFKYCIISYLTFKRLLLRKYLSALGILFHFLVHTTAISDVHNSIPFV